MTEKGIMPKDLTNEVTVFVATVGDRTNYDACIQALDLQDSRFRFEVVDHIAPMSAAFQRMIDHCETPYYVQVDEDMILDPYAIRILYDAISQSPPGVAIVCYSLWDEHMEQSILGVKIYRHAVLKQFPYRHDVPNCDTEQNDRLKAAGYTVKTYWQGYDRNLTCIGRHGCHYTAETVYEAYYNRAMKSRLFPEWMSWARQLLSRFRQRVQRNPGNTVDLYAMLGFAAGLSADVKAIKREKDFRQVNHEFRRLQADMETAPPGELSLHVTSRCNLSCQWCPRKQQRTKPDMSMEVLRRALDVCPSFRSACIAGFGEPLLCSTLEPIVSECKRRSMYVGLITNGVLLTDYAKHLRAWGVDTISVSLNAATDESHEQCNGTKTWQLVLAGIHAAVKWFPGRVAVSMVCHRDNVAEMEPFLELAEKLNVAAVDFLSLLPHADCDNSDFWQKRLGECDAAEIESLKAHPNAKLVRTWPTIVTGINNPRACRSPYVSVSMDSEGAISPCRRVMPPDKEKWGSIFAPCPPWRLPKVYQLRSALEGDRELPEVCKMCFGCFAG